jgi:hypothetical protein
MMVASLFRISAELRGLCDEFEAAAENAEFRRGRTSLVLSNASCGQNEHIIPCSREQIAFAKKIFQPWMDCGARRGDVDQISGL